MKKNIISCILILVIMALVGCSSRTVSFKMQIEPAKLTDEENRILSLYNSDSSGKIFDYSVEDTIKTIHISLLHLNNDAEWKDEGKSSISINHSEGRLLISVTKDGDSVRIAAQNENGITSWQSLLKQSGNTRDRRKGAAWQSSAIKIVPEEIIPLGIWFGTDKDSFSIFDLEYSFENTVKLKEFNNVYAITINFSKDEVK